jgi:DNA-binding transcriptional ArsR family regulator
MTSSPPDVALASIKRLLFERIETYDQLEVLLWLCSGNGEPQSAPDAAAALSLPKPAVTEALSALTAAGLLRRVVGSDRFRYEPETPELETVVRELALLYEHDRVQVIRIMSAQAIARLRRSALQAFAPSLPRVPRK